MTNDRTHFSTITAPLIVIHISRLRMTLIFGGMTLKLGGMTMIFGGMTLILGGNDTDIVPMNAGMTLILGGMTLILGGMHRRIQDFVRGGGGQGPLGPRGGGGGQGPLGPPGSAPDYLGEQYFVGGGQGPLGPPPLDPRLE